MTIDIFKPFHTLLARDHLIPIEKNDIIDIHNVSL